MSWKSGKLSLESFCTLPSSDEFQLHASILLFSFLQFISFSFHSLHHLFFIFCGAHSLPFQYIPMAHIRICFAIQMNGWTRQSSFVWHSRESTSKCYMHSLNSIKCINKGMNLVFEATNFFFQSFFLLIHFFNGLFFVIKLVELFFYIHQNFVPIDNQFSHPSSSVCTKYTYEWKEKKRKEKKNNICITMVCFCVNLIEFKLSSSQSFDISNFITYASFVSHSANPE